MLRCSSEEDPACGLLKVVSDSLPSKSRIVMSFINDDGVEQIARDC